MNLKAQYQQVQYCLLFLFLGIGICHPLIGSNNFNTQERPIIEVLNQLSEKYEVLFSYNTQALREINVDFEFRADEKLEVAINRLLTPINYSYETFGKKYYVIFEQSKAGKRSVKKIRKHILKIEKLEQKENVSVQRKPKNKVTQIQSVARTINDLKAQFVVSGTVVDERGEPMIGVNILERGTLSGTTTDLDGNYQIEATSENAILIFSYTGYLAQEIPIDGKSRIDIVLEEDVAQLNEVVVVGYGSQRKGSVTGAVASINTEEITSIPVPSFTEAMQGRMPGVQVTNNGGPGTDPIVRIRGIGSISFASNPLYVVDGYPVGGLNDFDNNDIASITVLKDASAAAIYGSRAANGVVIVTTKRGEEGNDLRVNYNGYVGFAEEWNRLDLLNREQYLQYGRLLLDNAGASYPDRWANLDEPIYEGTNQTYAQTEEDYQEAIFNTGLNTAHNLSLSGGNEYSTFYSSFGYFKQEGIMLGTEYERLNFRINSDHKFAKRIKVGQTLAITSGFRENEQNGGGRTQLQNTIRGIPYIPIFDPTLEGGYRAPDNSDGSDPENPVRVALLDRNFNNNTRIFGTVYAGVEILQGLEYKFTAGVDYSNNRGQTILPIYFDGFSGREEKSIADNRNEFIGTYLSNQLSFNRTFGDHSFDLVAIAERQDNRSNRLEGRGLRPSNDLDVLNGSSNPQVFGTLNENTIFSYAGRLNYNYAGRYLLSVSLRRDGSSKFAEGFKYATFPGISAGWIISEEPFFKNNTGPISELKIRGSWGILGFEGIGSYESQAGILNNTSAVFDDAVVQGAFFDRLANRELEWETTTMTNIGIDVGLLKNRIQFSAEWYQRETDNLILNVPLPTSLGYARSTIANVGAMENWGLEFQGVYYSKSSSSFKWDVAANLGLYRNEVTALATETASIFGGANGDFGGFDITRTAVGDPIQSFYGWVVEGIFQDQAQIDQYNARGDADVAYQANAAPGDLIFADLDNDGTITPDDRQVIGSFIPDFTYGINFNAEYKNIFFSMFWNGVQGNDVYNGTKVLTQGGLRLFNAGTEVLDSWTPQNSNTDIPRMVNGDPNQNTRTSDRFLEDGSFLRLQSLRIGYRFPTSFLNTFGNGLLKKLDVYVSGQNLLTFTGYTGYDPEIGSRFNNVNTNGIDYGQFPRPRTILFGVNVGF